MNVRFLIKHKLEGFGWFSYEILKRLVEQHPAIRFYFLFDRDFDPSFVFAENVTPIKISPPARHPFLWYWWFEVAVPRALKDLKPDLFISTDGYLSLNLNVKNLLFWHDLSYLHFPGHIPYLTRKFYERYVPKYLAKADKILTFSNFSADEVVERMGIPKAKIKVSYGAPRSVFKPLSDQEAAQVRHDLTGGNPYFIYVGALHPRKNVATIIKAFDEFKSRSGTEFQLLLVGRLAWKYGDITDAFEKAGNRTAIKFLGHVENDLHKIIGAAHAMIYPSFYEGFGLPIIEAIACGVPAITSNVSSMPEVCGRAGLLVDPASKEEIVAAMAALAVDVGLYKSLQAACAEQAGKFSWDKTASDLYELLSEA